MCIWLQSGRRLGFGRHSPSYVWALSSSNRHCGARGSNAATPTPDRKILYYRNPMGAPDTSPVPKKDSMGMDYIPVYADEQDDAGTVKISLDKIQRSGVRTEKVELGVIAPVRAVGQDRARRERS